LLYQHGLGVAKNNEQAATWLRRAADQGYAVAQNELGVMYAKGMGVPRNLSETVRWCALAAAQGSQVAKRNLQLARTVTAAVIPELTTSMKRSYDHAVLRKVESNGITISFQPAPGGWGMAKLKLEELPSDLRQVCKCAAGDGIDSNSPYSQLKEIRGTL
jgi:TPR repeat protein